MFETEIIPCQFSYSRVIEKKKCEENDNHSMLKLFQINSLNGVKDHYFDWIYVSTAFDACLSFISIVKVI